MAVRDQRSVIVRAEGLSKHYRLGDEVIRAVDGVDLAVEQGEFLCVMGPSGSGKSTLLHLLGLLEAPDAGAISVRGKDTRGLDDNALTRMRRDHLGFVFQSFELVPTLTARENILLPARLARRRGQGEARLAELARYLGIEERLGHKPRQMSGGELQRVCLARALINDPVVVLADEPTGNLDSRTGTEVVELFQRGVEERGWTVIMVSHDARVARYADRLVALVDGRMRGEYATDDDELESHLEGILSG